jgi:pimeloyl-ACP methyl ester carboxylesterase
VSERYYSCLLYVATYFAFARPENKRLKLPQGVQGMATNTTNIVLVHGLWADGSSWSKVIPTLEKQDTKLLLFNFLSILWQMMSLL